MAITPNTATESANKSALRGVTRGGSTPTTVNPPVDVAIMVNSAVTTSGILELAVGTGTTTFTISGANGVTTTLTGTATGSKVSDLVTALSTTALSGYTFYVNAGPANYLYNTTTSIIVPSGVGLTVVSGAGAVPTITAFAFSGTEGTTYPNYVGIPYATPNWVDDSTVHAYQVGFNGALVVNNNGTLSGANVVQQQVRQIQTQVSETQQYNGYFATYSGNLYQTKQKNTYRQQS